MHNVSPKWTGFKAGWLESQTEAYYIFRVDRYAAWSGLVPAELKKDLDLSPRYRSVRIENDYLVGDKSDLEDAWMRYRNDLVRKEKDVGIRIKSAVSSRFNLASNLVIDGVIHGLQKW